MAVRKVVVWPSATLSEVSNKVRPDWQETDEFKRLLADMYDTMYAAGGVGLAAIQVGVPARLFVMDPTGRGRQAPGAPQCFIDPVITEFIDDPVAVEEGCLSLPGVREKALRHPEIILTYRNLVMETRTAQLSGLEAQIAQHEMEHLDGKIFVETMGFAKRDLIKRKIAKTLRQRRAR